MPESSLNLARKWRPQSFNEVIGQTIPINMLRNSLYKNHFFPVYLFAGQRGCGKTSTARILAAAINCHHLEAFQANSGGSALPCLSCESCQRMQKNTHADFIEIDAASHTGVEDVRSLLEACTFMPLMGQKKIYLIDEAHMLSKAAFNAFLKMLEEPPATVIFMLATTEREKIPETIRSRCFHLQFNAIDYASLLAYLKAICTKEGITYEPEALPLIVEETEGSARDAINLLEQVRFSHDTVSCESVQSSLGILSEHRLAELFTLMLEKKPKKLLSLLKEISFETTTPARIWRMLLVLCRTLILRKYGVAKTSAFSTLEKSTWERLLNLCSLNRLHAIMQLLWEQEDVFLATPYKHLFLETLFLQVCEQVNTASLDEIKALLKQQQSSSATPQSATATTSPKPTITRIASAPSPQTETLKQKHTPQSLDQNTEPIKQSSAWQAFVSAIEKKNDPLLTSIFKQAHHVSTDQATGNVTIRLAQHSSFLLEKIDETHALWLPMLKEHFSGCTTLVYATPSAPIYVKKKHQIPPPTALTVPPKVSQKAHIKKSTPLKLTEENRKEWPIAHLLSTHFPGTLELSQKEKTS